MLVNGPWFVGSWVASRCFRSRGTNKFRNKNGCHYFCVLRDALTRRTCALCARTGTVLSPGRGPGPNHMPGRLNTWSPNRLGRSTLAPVNGRDIKCNRPTARESSWSFRCGLCAVLQLNAFPIFGHPAFARLRTFFTGGCGSCWIKLVRDDTISHRKWRIVPIICGGNV